jgi:hypothetical protein
VERFARIEDVVSEIEWTLVYQGGHHNIYCNGVEHIRSTGGWTGICKDIRFMDRFKCDCVRYKDAERNKG